MDYEARKIGVRLVEQFCERKRDDCQTRGRPSLLAIFVCVFAKSICNRLWCGLLRTQIQKFNKTLNFNVSNFELFEAPPKERNGLKDLTFSKRVAFR